jgi:peptidoglycan/LPS O-acetylase OafA/YrhL
VVALKVDPLMRRLTLVSYPLLGTVAAYLIVILTSNGNSFLTYLLSLPPIVALGRISYGVYLWHYLIIHELSIENRLFTHRILLAIVLTFAAAIASYWLIERPFLRLNIVRSRPRPSPAHSPMSPI